MSDDPVGTSVENGECRAEITRFEPNSYDGFNQPCEVVYGKVEHPEGAITEFRIILRIRHEPFGTETSARYVAECVAYEWDSEAETTRTELYHFTTKDHRITWAEMLEDVVEETERLLSQERDP